MSRNPRNLRPEPSSLVSTFLTHSGDDEDSEDSGIISFFLLLESPESSHRIQLRNVRFDFRMDSREPRTHPASRRGRKLIDAAFRVIVRWRPVNEWGTTVVQPNYYVRSDWATWHLATCGVSDRAPADQQCAKRPGTGAGTSDRK